jgi:hypothetical protein
MAIDESPLDLFIDSIHRLPARPLKRPAAQMIAARRSVGKYPSLAMAYAGCVAALAK